MEIRFNTAEAVVESVVTLSTADKICLGYHMQTIHMIVENRKELEKYEKMPYDKQGTSSRPEKINLTDKNIHDRLIEELKLLDKFMDKFVIRSTDSNVFD